MKFIEITLTVYDLPDDEDANEDSDFEPQSITVAFEDEASSNIYDYAQECMDGINRLVSA